MPGNSDIQVAVNYHQSTKHSYASVRTNPHFLDFNNQPLPFKIYPNLVPSPLPTGIPQTGIAALSAIAGAAPSKSTAPDTTQIAVPNLAVPNLDSLAQILFLSAGITRQRKYPSGEIFFRAAACTGALYEVELYLVCADLPDLPAGLYHFAPAEFGLRQLRAGDYRDVLIEATGADPSISHAPLTIISTCTYWRNAWKYQARTYRHFGWDNGTLVANMLAVASALGLPAKLICGFVDKTVNRLLDVDSDREVAFSLVALGSQSASAREGSRLPLEMPPLGLETVPLSSNEIDYPLMREMHAASSLDSPVDVAAWRTNYAIGRDTDMDIYMNIDTGLDRPNPPATEGSPIALQPLSEAEMPRDSVEQVILRRGSSRKFARTPISLSQLSTILDRATRGIPADFLQPAGSQLNELYLIVNAVTGLQPGAYVFHRNPVQLQCLKQGDFRDRAGYLGLEQQLPADAGVNIFFLADLPSILKRFGNRGYRATQLEAGIIGGKIYLAAYAQRLGATGLTFYDDEVTGFFSPHAAGKSAIFLVAVGNTLKRKPGQGQQSPKHEPPE